MCHGSFNSNKIYFLLHTYLIEYRKKLAIITVKSLKNQYHRQRQTGAYQNVSNEVLLAWFKFQAKILTRYGVCAQGEWQKCTCQCPPLSKDEGLNDIGHGMNTRNLILSVNSVTVSYLIRYDSLLKCDRYYYKLRQLFYYKMRQKFITKCVRFYITKWNRSLLQNVSGFFITKCNSYYKLQQLYYKMWQLLQNATFITDCDSIVLNRNKRIIFHLW